MKKVILCFMTMCMTIGLLAQIQKRDAIFLDAEVNLGNYSGVSLNLNYLFKQNISFKVGAHALFNESSEYKATNEITGYHVLIGKVLFDGKGSTRWNLSAGLGSSKTVKAISSTRETGSFFGFFSYNYNSVKYEESNELSFIINPKIEFPFSEAFGLTISPFIIANKVNTAAGIGIGIMIGQVR